MGKLNVIAEPGKQEIIMTREFNAPRDLIFRVLTDPTMVDKWWGPESLTTIVDKMEVRKGGIWRYIQQEPDGTEYIFNGVYHDITPPERLIHTLEYEGMPGHVILETVTLTEENGKTLLTDVSVFQSVEDRDGMLQSGMEQGASEGWDRLEQELMKLKA